MNDNSEQAITIVGQLERVIFKNDGNGYCVVEIRTTKTGDKFTACGMLPGVQCGETLELTGTWTTHDKHGLQFNIEKFESKLPSDIHGIRRYLGSGLIDGIGKIYAKKIVDHFGTETFNILSNESSRLLEIEGIGECRAKKIKDAWRSQFAIRDVMIFLQTYGVSNALCLKLYEKYGDEARHILETDPYRVSQEVNGVGFKTADKIAKNIGIATTHPSRIDAGLLHVISCYEEEGHTCIPLAQLIKSSQVLLELSPERIEKRIQNMITFGKLCMITDDIIQKSSMRKTEESIEKCLYNIIHDKASTLPDIWTERAIDWVQSRESMSFANEQISAITSALTNKISILTGGPGTGKTTILRALVSILTAKRVKVVLCAPTGRAAQKLSETTGQQAQTIHRLLQYTPSENQFSHNEENPLKLDFIIIDEASMVDTYLACALFRAIPTTAHVVIVGDIDQLQSVGPGNVLGDIIRSQKFPVTRLNKIFRQDACSEIVSVAHDIINSVDSRPTTVQSINEINPLHDFHFIESTTPEDCLEKIIALCKDHLPKWYNIDPIDDVQILVPVHKGTIGTENINTAMQNTFIDNSCCSSWTTYRIGDKVIQSKNNYDKNIFNGDLGRIQYIDDTDNATTIRFNDDCVTLNKSNMADINLAYAISIHKSQGSEFPVVIIAILRQHYIMLQRNLIYTAITRGKNKVFIVGDPTAYSIAVNNKERAQRLTGLYRQQQQ